MPPAVAILRIELLHIQPLIWRRIAVPTTVSLKTMHEMIQAAMGWLNYHLWEFTINDLRYRIPDPDWSTYSPPVKDGVTTSLASVLSDGLTDFGYLYDFGDNWEHRIVVESTKSPVGSASSPLFLGGERRCPPEGCGGPPGYFDFMENIANKRTKRAKDALDWYGGPYDGDDIDEKKINAAFRRIAKSFQPKGS
jgi:hypothetical protein